MNKNTLFFFIDMAQADIQGLLQAASAPDEVPEEDFKRAMNVQLEAIKADVANIQHLLES